MASSHFFSYNKLMTQPKLYIIEDDATIVGLLKKHFSSSYQVQEVQDFRDVLTELTAFSPDLILMDIGLPYFNGFYWTERIRQTMTVPIIFISSKDDEVSAVTAMTTGADDFISKPFSLAVLEAKLAAVLRRVQQFDNGHRQFEGFTLSLDGLLTSATGQIQLSPTETKLLALLFEKAHQTVTKEALLDKLWEGGDFIDQNTLSVNMTRLRKKLRDVDFDRIVTVRGEGYRLC